jgi:hypothetical protein
VVALTAETAATLTASGGSLTYRKHNKPVLEPLGGSLGDFDGVAQSQNVSPPHYHRCRRGAR